MAAHRGDMPEAGPGDVPRQFRRELVHRAAVSGPEVTAPAGYRGSACRRRLGTAVADDGRAMVGGGLVRPGGRNARVRTRVVWALLVELGDRPFDTVTMSGLATRSGIARATLHRRWGDPGAVLADAADDLLQRRMGRGIGTISRAAPDPRPSSTDLLVVHLRSLVAWLSRPETSAVLLAAMARTQHDDVLAVRTVRLWDHELDDLRRVLSRTVPAATEQGHRAGRGESPRRGRGAGAAPASTTGRTGCPRAGRASRTNPLVSVGGFALNEIGDRTSDLPMYAGWR